MRFLTLTLALALALTACTESDPPPAAVSDTAISSVWFICDAIDAPAVVVFERQGDVVRTREYDKPNGAIVERMEYAAAAVEGAAGSAYTTLMRSGAEAGVVRQVNPGMLETPGAAYTAPFFSVRLGDRALSCRWLPRTRIMGLTGRRSFVVHEDADGDLIYTSYDFADAWRAQPVDLSENGRTTTFSTEVRGGSENVTPQGAEYRFDTGDGHTYVVTLRHGEGTLQVLRDGASIQEEPLVAYQQGSAEE